MIYKVLRIDEDLDYGCEERAVRLAVVSLEDEEHKCILYKEEDDLLYQRNINEGDYVMIDSEGHLYKR